MSVSRGSKIYTVIEYDDYRKDDSIEVLGAFIDFDDAYNFVVNKRQENLLDDNGEEYMNKAWEEIGVLTTRIAALNDDLDRIEAELDALKAALVANSLRVSSVRPVTEADKVARVKSLENQRGDLYRKLGQADDEVAQLRHKYGDEDGDIRVYAEGEFRKQFPRPHYDTVHPVGKGVLVDVTAGFRNQRLSIFSTELS